MTTFHITWRPSGGRGEFEYSPVDSAFEDKPIAICVGIKGADCMISTDGFLARNGGKRRLRRTAPNDRTHLSIPNLVSAMLAVPKPTRDRDNITAPSLTEGKWAIGTIELSIESQPTDTILRVRPLSLKPRHFFSPIDVQNRLETLESEAKQGDTLGSEVDAHLTLLASGTNTVALEKSALTVFSAFEAKNGDLPLMASPEEVEQARLFGEAEADSLPALSMTEGKKKLVAHLLRERKKALVKQKKDNFSAKHGRLFCECCKMSPLDMYGSDLSGLIEAHHRIPLNECSDDEVRVTSLDDLVLLCRNCH